MASGQKKQQRGVVLSDAPDKSITVGVSWFQRDRIYGKNKRRLTRLYAHDPENQASRGDTVLIEEARPTSKLKRWRLVQVLQKADLAEVQPDEIDPETSSADSEDER